MAISCSNGIKRTSQEFLFKNGCVFFSAFLLCFPLSLAGTITVSNDPVRTALGDDVTLGISIDESVVVCVWYRGAVDVNNFILRVVNGLQAEGTQYTRRESIVLPSHSLRIANATLADSGTYWVRITFTSAKEVQSNLTLKVLDGPETPNISLTPKMQIFPSGSNVTFSCSAESNPAAGYKWLYNGLSLNKNESSFVIIGIRVNQTGNYTCNAANSVTMKHIASTVQASIQERISRVEVNISKNDVVEYNNSVDLSCNFTGTKETLQWIKDKETLEIKPGIVLSNNNLSLHISNTSRDHTGNYSCKVCNAINCNISNSQHLNVYYGTDLPIITVYPKQPILAGSSVNITCTSASNPLPLYQWFLNDTLKPFMQTHAITNITKADEGTYRCVASNNQTGRMSSASIYITVTDAPEPHHLSAGAIAGIVIAVIVGAGAITGLIYYIVAKTGVTRGSGSSGLNEMNSKPTYNTGDKGAENQFVQEEPQYSSPTFKPSSPTSADTTINSSTDKTVYALVNAPKR